ncbi:lymphotoxin-alpha isoform 1-T2 [Spinachia spinachia]
MEGPSRSSRKYPVLEVWCGLLTVALVVMAALLFSIKPRSTEEAVSTVKPLDVIPTEYTNVAPLRSTGSSLSYIQLTKIQGKPSWQRSTPGCSPCPFVQRNDSIHFARSGLYFIYAQVTFRKLPESDQKVNRRKSVILKRNKRLGSAVKILVEGIFPDKTEGSVWVAKVVSLTKEDSISLEVNGEHHEDSNLTFWGVYEVR